jgi:polysaccharide chain length determinant protein (PEP-CTERM system associated)
MVQNGEFGLADVKRVVRKHWWIIPVCVVLCGAAGVLAALSLPKKYTSQTLVLVAKPMVPIDYVKPVVTEDLNQRLASMKEQILSRTRLEPVIEKFSVYQADQNKVPMEELIDRLRKAIEISPLETMPGTQDRSMPGFHVGVTFNNPQIAQQICTEITSMFMEQNSRALEQQAASTNSFISQQLDEAKAKLDAQDAKLAQFKRQFLGSLPEQEQTNLNLLTALNTQLEANTQALSRAQQDKAFNESMLSQQEATWKASQAGQNPQTLDDQLRILRDQLTSLESKYTDEHPDVIKTKKQIEDLQKRMAEAPKAVNSAGQLQTKTEPPEIQQLRAHSRQDEISIADLTKRQGQIQEQIRVLQGQVQASPMVEQQLKELTRNYQSALEFYNDLQKKRESSEMAKDLAHQQEGEQFRVLDPPNLPITPSFPKKSYFAGGGVAAGFVLSLAILYIFMMIDKTLHNERDVEMYLKLTVLAAVPVLEIVDEDSRNLGLVKRPLPTNA